MKEWTSYYKDIDSILKESLEKADRVVDDIFATNFLQCLKNTQPKESSKKIFSIKDEFIGKISTECDVIEDEKNYIFLIDMPGVKKENLSIELDEADAKLIISGTRYKASPNYTNSSIAVEGLKKDEKRCIKLNILHLNIQRDDIKASLEDGLLHLILPKETSLMKKITLE